MTDRLPATDPGRGVRAHAPDAANAHPETYPKFQVQLGRVVLLRDMINWCIENPVRGNLLADDDPRLKALEAYIIAQRKGVALEYGKH
jgi:thiosulfate dehydrogenase